MVKHAACELSLQTKTRVDALEQRMTEYKGDFNENIKEIKETVHELWKASNRIAWLVLTTVCAVLGQIIFYVFTKKVI